MHFWIAAATVLALIALPAGAVAERGSEHRKTPPSRHALNASPVKDCTRLNGRVGYYANPWCTLAEQDRWDRWETRRVKQR